jgi:hypothetical protein
MCQDGFATFVHLKYEEIYFILVRYEGRFQIIEIVGWICRLHSLKNYVEWISTKVGCRFIITWQFHAIAELFVSAEASFAVTLRK